MKLQNLALEQVENTIKQVRQGNEINNINQPVQQEKQFEEIATFVVESKEQIEQIKTEILEEFLMTQNMKTETTN